MSLTLRASTISFQTATFSLRKSYSAALLLLAKRHAFISRIRARTGNTPKPSSKAGICRFFVESKLVSQGRHLLGCQGGKLRKVRNLLFLRISVRGSQPTGKATTHRVAFRQHVQSGHGKSRLGPFQKKLFALFSNGIVLGIQSSPARPHKETIVMVSCNNSL